MNPGKESKWYINLINKALAVDTPQTTILENKINEHLRSEEVAQMKRAHDYYRNRTAIQEKETELKNRHNAKIELGLFKKLVRQKVGYLLSKPPSVTTEHEETQKYLNTEVFDRATLKEIKALGQEAIIKGIAFSQVYIDENGKLRLFKIPSEQVVVFWADERRHDIEAFGRIVKTEVWENGVRKEQTEFNYFDENGITYYLVESGRLKRNPKYPDIQSHYYYFNEENEVRGLNWEKAPIIAWRYDEDELSLLNQVESLIDNISLQTSTSADLLADIPKFIYVLKDYGGQDLGEFLHMLNEYMAVSVNGTGGVDKLQAEINTTATENELARNRKYLYEAAAAIDTQDENLGNASGMALKWRYTDLDLDMNAMEAEMQSSIEQLMWFIENHALNTGIQLNLSGFEYIFNRDMISNETEAIQNAQNSIGILDDHTIREQHPWYSEKVEKRLKKQNAKNEIPRRPSYDDPPDDEEEKANGENES